MAGVCRAGPDKSLPRAASQERDPDSWLRKRAGNRKSRRSSSASLFLIVIIAVVLCHHCHRSSSNLQCEPLTIRLGQKFEEIQSQNRNFVPTIVNITIAVVDFIIYVIMIYPFLGSGPDSGQSPVEWGDFPFVRLSVCPSVRPSIPPSGPASQA